MKKVIFTFACASFMYAQVSAQPLFKLGNPKNAQGISTQNNLFTNSQNFLDDLRDGKILPMSNVQLNTKRGAQHKPTGTEHRVTALYFMEYDGAQYNKVDDSTHFFFSGTRSFKQILGMDIAEYIRQMVGMEISVPEYPQYFPAYSDVSDSTLSFGINGAGTDYDDLNGRIINAIDANGNITESIGRNKSGGTWENDNKDIYNHTNNKITEHINQSWVSGAWENSEKELSTYDANDKLQEYSELYWTSGSWENNYNYLYQYDANGNCISQIDRVGSGASWENDAKYDLTYDANNNMTELIYSEWTSGAWEEDQKVIITYNSNGDQLTVLVQDKSGSGWLDDVRYTYTYSGNQKTNYLAESFDGTVWVKEQNNIYAYTSTGKMESMIMQGWDNVGSAWENVQKLNIEYNSLDLISELNIEVWNSGGFWEKHTGDQKYKFFYESYQTTGIHNLNLNDGNFNIYPNPTANTLNVNINLEQPTNCSVTILDISGRTFVTQKMIKAKDIQTKFDISALPAGSYFLKVTTSEGQVSKGFQVVR